MRNVGPKDMFFLRENQKQAAIENHDTLFIEQKTTVVQLKKEWKRFLDLANVESLSSMVVQLYGSLARGQLSKARSDVITQGLEQGKVSKERLKYRKT